MNTCPVGGISVGAAGTDPPGAGKADGTGEGAGGVTRTSVSALFSGFCGKSFCGPGPRGPSVWAAAKRGAQLPSGTDLARRARPGVKVNQLLGEGRAAICPIGGESDLNDLAAPGGSEQRAQPHLPLCLSPSPHLGAAWGILTTARRPRGGLAGWTKARGGWGGRREERKPPGAACLSSLPWPVGGGSAWEALVTSARWGLQAQPLGSHADTRVRVARREPAREPALGVS